MTIEAWQVAFDRARKAVGEADEKFQIADQEFAKLVAANTLHPAGRPPEMDGGQRGARHGKCRLDGYRAPRAGERSAQMIPTRAVVITLEASAAR